MTIDPADFKPQGKPGVEQMRAVYEQLPHQTIPALHERLVGLGYEISRATVGRAVKSGFMHGGRANMHHGKVKGVPKDIKQAAADIVGKELTKAEIAGIDAEIKVLGKLSLEELKAVEAREVLIHRIMMARMSTRRAEALVLVPRDSAAMVKSLAEAGQSLNTVPAAQQLVPGMNGHNMIDVTPERNEVADAIGSFLKQEGVAA